MEKYRSTIAYWVRICAGPILPTVDFKLQRFYFRILLSKELFPENTFGIISLWGNQCHYREFAFFFSFKLIVRYWKDFRTSFAMMTKGIVQALIYVLLLCGNYLLTWFFKKWNMLEFLFNIHLLRVFQNLGCLVLLAIWLKF